MTTPSFDSVEAQASYGIGLQIGQQLQESGLQGLLPEALLAGLRDAMEGNTPTVPVDVIHRALQEVHEKADKVRIERQQALVDEGKTFLEENAKRDDVTTTESGLQFSVLQAGDGRSHPVRTVCVYITPDVWLMVRYLIALLSVVSQPTSPSAALSQVGSKRCL